MRSWVWDYFTKFSDGQSATCSVCDAVLQTHGSTTTMIDHLTKVHNINASCSRPSRKRSQEHSELENHEDDAGLDSNQSNDNSLTSHPIPRKRARTSASADPVKPIYKERQEKITQALVKFIAHNKLPYSFAKSPGFTIFMADVEPGYKCPCSQTILCRLRILEDEVKGKIQQKLESCQYVALDTDCWTSLAQEGYMNVNAHVIDDAWESHVLTLSTQELDDRHTAENLADSLQLIAAEWQIDKKIPAIVNDNASNIVTAVNRMPNVEADVTCAAHTIHLSVQKALQHDKVLAALAKGSNLVTHFRHSVVSSEALKRKQEQLGLSKLKLVQSVRTRWNTDLHMAESLVVNRSAITAVLSDRCITSNVQARNLEITEENWSILEGLIEILKPLEIASTVLSGAPLSMVHSIIRTVIDNHLHKFKEDIGEIVLLVTTTLATELHTRFKMESLDEVSIAQIASFLDPRHKDLRFISASCVRNKIRDAVATEVAALSSDETNICPQTSSNSALDFLFKKLQDMRLLPSAQQFQLYLADPQIDINMDPLQ